MERIDASREALPIRVASVVRGPAACQELQHRLHFFDEFNQWPEAPFSGQREADTAPPSRWDVQLNALVNERVQRRQSHRSST